jgi:hypothetical protein
MNKKIFLLALISLVFLPAIKSGAAMVACPACASVCIIPFSPLCIACVLEFCVAVPVMTACFSSDTTIYKIEDGQIKEVSIYELKVNDLVLANNENKLTKVVRNIKNEGIFNYTQIILESGKELTITNEHGVIVLDEESNKRIMIANNLKEGQKLITMEGTEVIKKINKLKIKDKYILETEDGTVIANNIYVSTICDDMIDENMNSDELLKLWKNKHELFYKAMLKN